MSEPPHAHPRATSPRRPRVIVVDADRRVRDGLTGLLACDERVELAGSASHPAAAVALADATRPDVVVIDPRLPEVTDGVALIERLCASAPDLCVLVLAWSGALERVLGEDPRVSVISPSAGPADLVDHIRGRVAAQVPAEAMTAEMPDLDARIHRSA